MEAIAAFALAGNVLQVIDIGCKVATILKQVYHDGTTIEYATLAENTQNLRYATSKLQNSTTRPAARDGNELCAIAQKCADIAVEMEQKVAPISQTRRRDRLKKGLQTLWIKGDIEKLEAKLKAYRDVLNTQILVNLRGRLDILAIEQQEGFNSLESTTQEFCRQQADIRKQELDLVVREIREGSHKITTTIQTMQLTTGYERQYDRLLSSLIFPSMNARKNQISLAHTNTCEWIFGISPGSDDKGEGEDDAGIEIGYDEDNDCDGDHSGKRRQPLWDDFGHWLRTGNDIYWISGKAGSGKSTLMKLLHDHKSTSDLLKQWAAPQDVLCLESYLWDAGSEAQKSVRGLIATLLMQILQHLPHLGKVLLEDQTALQKKTQFEDWSAEELQSCLFLVFRTVDQRICLFIDGLDESRAVLSEPPETLVQFIFASSRFTSVKCCVSSRPLRVFESAFSGCSKLRLEYLNRSDIEKVYRDRLTPSIREVGMVTDAELDFFQQDFVFKSNGVFLWAYLAIESLRQGIQNLDSFEELKKRLDILPSELNDLYEHMWKQQNVVDSTLYREEASRFLNLRLLDDSPFLNLSLLQCTLSLPRNKNLRAAAMAGRVHGELLRACEITQVHIKTRCAGLLEIVPDSSEFFSHLLPLEDEGSKLDKLRFTDIQFIHRTARDFLLTTTFGRDISASHLTHVELAQSLFRARLCEMSLSSEPIQLELLTELLPTIQYMTKRDEFTMLRTTEDVCANIFSRTHRRSETAADWFILSKDDVNLRYYSNGRAISHTSFDFLAFTVSCDLYALAEHYLCASLRKVNATYSKYCLLSLRPYFGYDYMSDFANIETVEKENRQAILLSTLLRLSYGHNTDPTKQNLDNDSSNSMFFEWEQNYALRVSVQSHLCAELLTWVTPPDHPIGHKIAYILCQFLALQTNLNEEVLYGLSITNKGISENGVDLIEMRKATYWRLFDMQRCVLIFTCNVRFLMDCWLEHNAKFFQNDAFLNIQSRLSDVNVEPSIRCLVAWVGNGACESSCSRINDEDSEHFSASLKDALPNLCLPALQLISSSEQESFSANIEAIHGRGEPINLFDYLKETGWVKDLDDPGVMRRPPPMYLDDEEVQPINTAMSEGDGETAENEPEIQLESLINNSLNDQTDDEFF